MNLEVKVFRTDITLPLSFTPYLIFPHPFWTRLWTFTIANFTPSGNLTSHIVSRHGIPQGPSSFYTSRPKIKDAMIIPQASKMMVLFLEYTFARTLSVKLLRNTPFTLFVILLPSEFLPTRKVIWSWYSVIRGENFSVNEFAPFFFLFVDFSILIT